MVFDIQDVYTHFIIFDFGTMKLVNVFTVLLILLLLAYSPNGFGFMHSHLFNHLQNLTVRSKGMYSQMSPLDGTAVVDLDAGPEDTMLKDQTRQVDELNELQKFLFQHFYPGYLANL